MEGFESCVRSMETSHRSKLVLRCKVVVVGDAHVGKTALVSMFASGSFPKTYVMTAWTDFSVKEFIMAAAAADNKNNNKNNTVVELYIFDCGGQSIFNQIEANAACYENANYVIIAYDATNQSSFESCGKWLQQVAKRSQVILVETKQDLEDRRVIPPGAGAAFADAHELTFFQTTSPKSTRVL
ncbi:hypothetical protein CTAYLR_003774 [Chrysophaeum taylorii]|uniref:Uncharacterized protein n=1 Tax=Chrysophaeum taylorii TaxID=2483200 RepID=A0AAD7UD75_9STRA|nr:hypothetical protein CTAYLR_003774 [Chrysophaeum taylorii]